ncbi:MAG: putative ABC transporter permease [Bacilli bacterium]|nr:putative ABC transporter permease [Bacilli bacterium]
MNEIYYYFLLFLIYSFIGWLIEVIGKLIEKHKFINRGFLIGPICPIYGHGCLLMILTLSRYKDNPLTLFICAIFICSLLEYFTSYFMEKIFKARWWDYSTKRFNLNGRICAETMIPFGILGTLVICVINPIFEYLLNLFNFETIKITAIVLFIIYIIDYTISLIIMFGFKGTLKTVEKDGTEEITKKVKKILINKNVLYKRLVEAFPNFMNPKERLLLIKARVEKELKKYMKKDQNNLK